MVADAMFAK